jgi:16S rRNA G966 N2-methylase RsmD
LRGEAEAISHLNTIGLLQNMESTKRAIEEYFPIVEINRLAIPERNSFKPIYQMHKWFARRASCVFRAILLGAMKPAGTDIMEEFYKDHTHDPDTNGKVILDPFMGGGTTVVEALRLGCKVIGIDLNPVAWFIVKTEVEPVNIDSLKEAFERLANRPTSSGKTVREELLSHYKTKCPCCNNGNAKTASNGSQADIIYTFWVKSAICTNSLCKKEVPLFSDYTIAQKSPSIRYYQDISCPKCKKTFDWEVEPASLVGESRLMIKGPESAGIGRSNKRWAYSPKPPVVCPWCEEQVTPGPSLANEGKKSGNKNKLVRKKVPLNVLYCPNCAEVWQIRGSLEEEVTCPTCRKVYNPYEGNVPEKGKFVCPACGAKDRIINSIRKLPKEELLPIHPYAIEGYCSICGGDKEEDEEEEENLFNSNLGIPLSECAKKVVIVEKDSQSVKEHDCRISKNNGKFFKKISPADIARYQEACSKWQGEKDTLPYPNQKIPDGQETHRLLEHHYYYWHQMFNPRQLLCLSTLLKAIDEESGQTLKEMLLSAFYGALEGNNLFCRYTIAGGSKSQGIFSRHDFQPKLDLTENNVWGSEYGHGPFGNKFNLVLEGKEFYRNPFDRKFTGNRDKKGNPILKNFYPGDTVDKNKEQAILHSTDSRALFSILGNEKFDFIITDPPYASNVNYSELADFFYVWLRLILAKTYNSFAPELTPKAKEIIVNPTRGLTEADFKLGLQAVFEECNRKLSDKGPLLFTFHHGEGKAWEALLEAVCDAGFEIDSIYPIQGEAETSLHLMDKQSISYDLIHLCKKRPSNASITTRSWAGIRQEIRRRAREEIEMIEAGRYGRDPLSPGDVNMILIGKCLELYSRHYGAVVDHEDNPVPLSEALKQIKGLVDQLTAKEKPLPSELTDLDPESYIYLISLCEKREIKSDEVHKATRGILEIEDLMKAALITKGRVKGGRTYEVKSPMERYSSLSEMFQGEKVNPQTEMFGEDRKSPNSKHYFIDKIHFLMALAETKESLIPWLEKWRGESREIRAACAFLSEKRKEFAPVLAKITKMMEAGPLFR